MTRKRERETPARAGAGTPSAPPSHRMRGRPASAYPKEFLEIFQYARRTNAPVVINTLERNTSAAYTTLRAEMHRWRVRMRAEGSPMAKDLDELMVTAPKEVDGRWQITVEPASGKLSKQLQGIVPQESSRAHGPQSTVHGPRSTWPAPGLAPGPAPDTETEPPSAMQQVVEDLWGEESDDA